MKAKILALMLVLCAVPSYALSDAEYTQMMKDKNFAQADKQLTQAYRAALKTLAKNKTAQEKFRQLQREWIASGRDEDAEAMMSRYNRTRAYTMATRARAEDLPGIAQELLKSSSRSTPTTRTPTRSQPKPAVSDNYEIDTEGYPMQGLCTGNNVRLRDAPSTKSKVIDAANDMDIFILVGEAKVNGDLWYELDNPKAPGTLWISGQFIDPDKSDAYGKPAYTMALRIRMMYGDTPEKARAMFGSPVNDESEKFYFEPAKEELLQETLEYRGFKLNYIEGRLNHVEVNERGHYFVEVQVGDSKKNITDALGTPSGEGDEGITYDISDLESLQFELRDGKISFMSWDHYMD